MKNKYLYIFYLFGSIVLIYTLSVNNNYWKVLNNFDPRFCFYSFVLLKIQKKRKSFVLFKINILFNFY
jgi:hypothetical protein